MYHIYSHGCYPGYNFHTFVWKLLLNLACRRYLGVGTCHGQCTTVLCWRTGRNQSGWYMLNMVILMGLEVALPNSWVLNAIIYRSINPEGKASRTGGSIILHTKQGIDWWIGHAFFRTNLSTVSMELNYVDEPYYYKRGSLSHRQYMLP